MRHLCQQEGDRPYPAGGGGQADNSYSLIAILGRGHLAIKAGGAVYAIRCASVEMVPRFHRNCTEEIPALLLNGT
jgi:hypothetical protein